MRARPFGAWDQWPIIRAADTTPSTKHIPIKVEVLAVGAPPVASLDVDSDGKPAVEIDLDALTRRASKQR